MRDVFETAYRVGRPYSTAYVALCAFCGSLAGPNNPPFIAYVVAIALVPLFSIAIVSFNDYAHWEADRRAERGRSHDKSTLLALGVSASMATLLLIACAGIESLLILVLSIFIGILYGILKHIPLLGNILRGAITGLLVLANGAIVGINNTTMLISLGVGLLDASGNIWGDIRDADIDSRVGNNTIAVKSPRLAIVISMILLLSALLLLSEVNNFLYLFSLFGVSIIVIPPRREGHIWFLAMKYVIILFVAMKFARTGAHQMTIFVLSMLLAPSLLVYKKLHAKRLQRPYATPDESR